MAIIQIVRKRLRYGVLLFVLVGFGLGIVGIDYWDELQFVQAESGQTQEAPKGSVQLTIKVPQRVLEVYDNGVLHKRYRIAVGKSETPTPLGEWNVVWKSYNWGTGFGTRWMGLNVPWGIYGIHGTNKPWSIGQFASHGCIRMRNKDVEELFEWVPVGTPVRIEGGKMRISRVLKPRMSGSDVAVLQMKLKELGLLEGRADGQFGSKTQAAVEQYQRDNQLEINGIVERKMLDLLGI